jgi:single-strand DNA-binding protein
MNQCEIIGNLGADPTMRYIEDGTPVTTFSVAVNRRWTKDDGSTGEKTWWFRVTAWRKLAETCNMYLEKGKQVFVQGEISASAWMPQDSDRPRASLELTARTVRFLGSANGNGSKPPEMSDEELDAQAENIPF